MLLCYLTYLINNKFLNFCINNSKADKNIEF